jgi:ClpA/ClpB-like protein
MFMGWFKSFLNGITNPPASGWQPTIETDNNFTPRAQQVLALSRKEAINFNHNFVGTEHLLLGLIRLGQGRAVNVLRKMKISLEALRSEVEKQVGKGPTQLLRFDVPFTPRVKKVLALAMKEAKKLSHNFVGTEHILLGLLAEGDGVAARVLFNLGVNIETTRQEILRELDPNFTPEADTPPLSPATIPASAKLPGGAIDITKRYDIYSAELEDQVVVYRNCLIKGTSKLPDAEGPEINSKFIQLEQADGSTIFVALPLVIKFCEPGTTPNCKPAPGVKP